MTVAEDVSRLREKVLLDLAKRDKTNARETFRGITEGSALALSVTRVGIWRLTTAGSELLLEDMFVLAEHRHVQGAVRSATESQAYFDTIRTGRTLVVDDTRSDARTPDLAGEPRDGTTSRMDVPIWHRGSLYGVVSYEHQGPARHWRRDEVEFAGNLADVAALTLEASERQALENRWVTVVEVISEAILVFDRNGRLLQSNEKWRPLIEKLHAELFTLEERRRILELRDLNGLIVPHDDWPGPRALRGEHFHQVLGVSHRTEGLLGYFRVFATPTYDGDAITGFVGVLTDVTEEIQFERLKAEFLATLGFEMKVPVSTVRVTADDLLRRKPMTPVWRKQLDAIARASRRQERLIDDVVEITALATVTLVRELVNIRGLVEAEIAGISSSAPRHSIHLSAPVTARVSIDRGRIEKVVERLLDNAIRFSPKGGDIDVTLDVTDKEIVVAIRDHGIGIPADKQPHIFEMFYRAHARTTYDFGGLGLGLYLSREIARMHGGDLWFESVEGQGSCFYLRLPREVRS